MGSTIGDIKGETRSLVDSPYMYNIYVCHTSVLKHTYTFSRVLAVGFSSLVSVFERS